MDIVLNGIRKSFGEKVVLDNFSAVFKTGKIYCLTGRSGSGKTTLINIILGLQKEDAGRLSGVDQPMACVFQEDRLLMSQTATDNITAFVRKKLSEGEITAALTRLKIEGEDLQKPLSQFSGGMLRRVAIARAILADRPVLLLDEPFKGLDGTLKEQVAAYIREQTVGRTVIFTTHDLREIAMMNAAEIKLAD